MGPRNTFIAIVAVGAIGTGAWLSSMVMQPAPRLQTATVLPAPSELPEFSLVDQNRLSIGRDYFEGHWNLVFFGFTHCPDICPLTLQVLANAKRQLAADGQQPLPRIVLVSVDPERDTPEVMSQYVRYFGDDNIGITGTLDEIRKLTGGLGIFFEKSGLDEVDYSVDHSAVVIVINPRGQFHALFGAPHEAGNFVHDLPIIMGGR
ncbi:MAG: SCO family protein [Gammaproteobacteria bacterium]|nr:SCO family protein [Gammaproteobacteria bacterium]MDH3374594.1 SCO family protein [Gammaproteobacteria bacterium]MDH3409987.1 SCO family protein [Gammaproteobacteria bacterium]MDH3554105.1 SCO family protein [Gammaproteobacteria bacterium]